MTNIGCKLSFSSPMAIDTTTLNVFIQSVYINLLFPKRKTIISMSFEEWLWGLVFILMNLKYVEVHFYIDKHVSFQLNLTYKKLILCAIITATKPNPYWLVQICAMVLSQNETEVLNLRKTNLYFCTFVYKMF